VDLELPLQHVGDAMGVGVPARLKDVVEEEAIGGLLRQRPFGVGERNILICLVTEQPGQGQESPSASDVICVRDVEVLVAHERSGFVC
jgi:hypothetical protein